MKVIAVVLLFAAVACAADDLMVGSSYGGSAPAPAPSYGGGSSSYGSAPASIPAPPCPKNYLFSCQPSLQPVPCSAPSSGGYGSSSSGGYGSAGAYSFNYPTYAVPPMGINRLFHH